MLSYAGRLNNRWEIAVAYGPDYQDEYDVIAWLDSFAHELLHLASFYRRHGELLPYQVGLRALARDYDLTSQEEDDVEEEANRLVDAFSAGAFVSDFDEALLRGVSVRRRAVT